MAITVSTGIFRPLHSAGAPFRRSEKCPTSLINPNWSDTTAAGCGQVCRARPCCHRVADHALRSAVAESENLAGAGAAALGNESSRPGEMLLALRRRWHEGPADATLLTSLRGWASALLSRTEHKSSYIQSRPICRIPLARDPRQMGPRRLPARHRDRRPGSLRYNCVLCSIRLLHCPAVCKNPHLAPVRAASGTVRRHPSCQRRCAASLFVLGRVCLPQSPRPIPEGACAYQFKICY